MGGDTGFGADFLVRSAFEVEHPDDAGFVVRELLQGFFQRFLVVQG